MGHDPTPPSTPPPPLQALLPSPHPMGVVSELSDGDRKLLAAYIHYLVLALRSNERFSHAGRFLDVLTEGPRNPFMGAAGRRPEPACASPIRLRKRMPVCSHNP